MNEPAQQNHDLHKDTTMSTNHTTVTSTSTSTSTSPKDLALAGLTTGIAAAVLAAITFGIISALGTDLVVPASPGSEDLDALPLAAVIGASLIPMLVGSAIFGLLERRTSNPIPIWRAAALGFGVLSLGGVMGLDAGTANVVGLGVLHLLVATVAAFGLPVVVARRRDGAGEGSATTTAGA